MIERFERGLARRTGLDVLGYGIESLVLNQITPFNGFLLMVIAWTAGMCLWQARNREQQHLELERQRDELARVAKIDPLTEALNRRGFGELLNRERRTRHQSQHHENSDRWRKTACHHEICAPDFDEDLPQLPG